LTDKKSITLVTGGWRNIQVSQLSDKLFGTSHVLNPFGQLTKHDATSSDIRIGLHKILPEAAK